MKNELFGEKIMTEDVKQRITGKIEDLQKLLPDIFFIMQYYQALAWTENISFMRIQWRCFPDVARIIRRGII